MIDTEYLDMAAKFAVLSMTDYPGFKLNWRASGTMLRFDATYRYRRRSLDWELSARLNDPPQELVMRIAAGLRKWLDEIRIEIDKEVAAP